MSNQQPTNLRGPIDDARIQYFRPHELKDDECYELSVFDVNAAGDDYQWYIVATFSTWHAARYYARREFPDALIGDLDHDGNDRKDADDESDFEIPT